MQRHTSYPTEGRGYLGARRASPTLDAALPLASRFLSVVCLQIFRTFGGRGWGLRLSDERGAEAGTVLHEYLGEVSLEPAA